MMNKFKVVRVKRTHNTHDKERQYHEFILMTYGDYCKSKEFVFLGEKTELHPYKWYDIRLLWMRLLYRLQKNPITVKPKKLLSWMDVILKAIKVVWKVILLMIM